MTTRRIHLTIVSALNLQFENQDLVEDLRAAKKHAEALNEQLEVRVRERTAELHRSTEQLQAEIAQREQIEEELLRARKLESLGVLAGGIAHDFNNFLTVVQGNLEMAKMRLDADEPVQAILDQIAGACQQASYPVLSIADLRERRLPGPPPGFRCQARDGRGPPGTSRRADQH